MEKDDKYSSARAFYEQCLNEYNEERNRTTKLDSKTNILISFSAVTLVAMLQAVNLKKLFDIIVTDFASIVFPAILSCLIMGAIVTSLISVIFLLRVICVYKYATIDLHYLYSKSALQTDESIFLIGLAFKLMEAVDYNQNVNKKRTKCYSIGILLLVISLIIFTVYMCMIGFAEI